MIFKNKILSCFFAVFLIANSVNARQIPDTDTLLSGKISPSVVLDDTVLNLNEKIILAEKIMKMYGDTSVATVLPVNKFLLNYAISIKDTVLINKYLDVYIENVRKLCNYSAADSLLKYKKLLVLSENNKRKLADYYYYVASNYYDWSRYEKAAEYFRKARLIYEKMGVKKGIAKCLKGEGAVWSNYSDFERAIGLLQRAEEIYVNIGFEKGIAKIHNSMGVVMQNWGKLESALQHYKIALKYFEKMNDKWNMLNMYLHIGDIYRLKKQYLSAYKEIKKAEKLGKQVKHKKLQSIIYSNLGEVMYDMGKYDSALYYQNLALPLKYQVGDRRRIAISLLDIVKINYKEKHYNKALKNAEKALVYAKQINANDLIMELYHLISDIYKEKHYYKKAYQYLLKYNKLHEIVFNEESRKQVNEFEVKYEAARKEKEYAILKKTNALNKLALNKEKESRFYMIILTSFILLLALITIFFINYRNRLSRKNYALLTRKNKEITQQKNQLAKLNDELVISRERYRSIVENATIGMYQTTPDGKILFANKTLLAMLGYTEEELKRIDLNKEKKGRKKFISMLEQQEIITGREDLWQRADGSEMWVNESAWIIRNSSGNIEYYEGIVEDITKRKFAEQEAEKSRLELEKKNKELQRINIELEKARSEAVKANMAKSQFLANISHEIRTPLNSIIGFTELLTSKISDPVSRNFINSIKTSSNSLLGLINDILDLSKIQAGKLELVYEPVYIPKLINEINQIFYPQIESKGLKFLVSDNITDQNSNLFLDLVRIRQVLFNVIGNAIKFTEKGEVNVNLSIDLCNDNEKLYNLTITVSDTGIGIPIENLTNIFESFEQAKSNMKKNYLGTGLGLSITKKLVEIMGGKIEVQSKKDIGSTFKIFLPCIKASNTVSDIKDRKINNTSGLKNSVNTGTDVVIPEPLHGNAKNLFETKFALRISALQNNHIVNNIVAFGEEVLIFAKENKLKNLEIYISKLLLAAHNFDIEAMDFYLNHLPEFYKK